MMPDEFLWKLLRRATLSICRRCWSVCQDWYVWILNLHNLFCRPNCVFNSQRVLCNITASFTLALLFLGRSCAMESLGSLCWKTWKCLHPLHMNIMIYNFSRNWSVFRNIWSWICPQCLENICHYKSIDFLILKFHLRLKHHEQHWRKQRDMTKWECRLHFVTTEVVFDVCLLPQRKGNARMVVFNFAEGVIIVLRGVVHIISLLAICAWIIIELKN